jgi:MoxR-like ATPase
MEEGRVTIEGETLDLPRPFVVCATENPIEFEGTYPLPEAQLDRFLLRTAVGYPERDEELQVLRRRIARAADEATVAPAITREELTGMQHGVEAVHVDDSLGYYMVDLVAATRSHPKVQVGASPRGGLALLKLARANAALDGRDYAVPDDVKAVAVPALAHRIALRPEFWVQRVRSEEIVTDCLASVPTPPPRDPRT